MSVVRVGSSKMFAENWDGVFGGKRVKAKPAGRGKKKPDSANKKPVKIATEAKPQARADGKPKGKAAVVRGAKKSPAAKKKPAGKKKPAPALQQMELF
jgi:uncharacterized membrane protein